MKKYKNITASELIKTGAGTISGIIVNSHTSGTVKLWDNTSAATTVICNTITFPAGSGFYKMPADISFTTGLYVTVGGTLDCTIVYS